MAFEKIRDYKISLSKVRDDFEMLEWVDEFTLAKNLMMGLKGLERQSWEGLG